MFWGFFIWLFIASMIFTFALPLIMTPILGLWALFVVVQKESVQNLTRHRIISFMFYPLMVLIFLSSVYIFSGWSAYVASSVLVGSSAPGVTHKWIYYLTGFLLCGEPLVYMASKEGPEISPMSYLYIVMAVVVYVLFLVWPILISWPYGWFLRWIY